MLKERIILLKLLPFDNTLISKKKIEKKKKKQFGMKNNEDGWMDG